MISEREAFIRKHCYDPVWMAVNIAYLTKEEVQLVQALHEAHAVTIICNREAAKEARALLDLPLTVTPLKTLDGEWISPENQVT